MNFLTNDIIQPPANIAQKNNQLQLYATAKGALNLQNVAQNILSSTPYLRLSEQQPYVNILI